jgi:hypothetical protein
MAPGLWWADPEINAAGDWVPIWPDEAPPQRDCTWRQCGKGSDDLGVTGRPVNGPDEIGTGTCGIDQRDGHRLERHRIVEHPRDLGGSDGE